MPTHQAANQRDMSREDMLTVARDILDVAITRYRDLDTQQRRAVTLSVAAFVQDLRACGISIENT